MIRTLSLAALAVCAAASPVLAQDGGWTFEVGAATDNRSKNASKTNGDPFAYGEATWTAPDDRFYAGAGVEGIDSGGASVETEAFVGFEPRLGGFDLDINLAYKFRPDADPGTDDDAFEFTADLERSIGPASGRLQFQTSPDGTGSTRRWTWIEARAGWDFTRKLTGTAAVGRRDQVNSVDYTGWNIGLTYAVTDDFEAELRWHDTDADVPGEQYAGALIAGFSYAF